ncbi:MAG: thioredoxin family protein [Algisphaera sp.]
MALTPSTMLDLGTPAPDFALPATGGTTVHLEDFEEQPLLVMFICNHCPFVHHVAPELVRINDQYAGQIGVVAIQSNDIVTHPDDAPEEMATEKKARGYAFPYLFDADQSVAKAFTAACTPDFFFFDADHKLVYRGQLDDSRPHRIASGEYDERNGLANGQDLRAAIDAVLAGTPVPEPQRPSAGCNIKWAAGSEPAYFTA